MKSVRKQFPRKRHLRPIVAVGASSETDRTVLARARARGRRRERPAAEDSATGGGEAEGTVEGGTLTSTSLSLAAIRSEKVGEGLAAGTGPGGSPGKAGRKVVLRGETTTAGTGGKDPPTVRPLRRTLTLLASVAGRRG
jgi:hypothetical protein